MKKIFSILALSAILFSSCGVGIFHRGNDYSPFPKGTVLYGKTKEGQSLFFVREDDTKMSGICFVDNHHAVTHTLSFEVDSTGAISFGGGNQHFSGKMAVKKLKTIVVSISDIKVLSLEKQKIKLHFYGTIPQKTECGERYKDPVFEDIVVEKNIQFGSAYGYYTSKPSDYLSKDDYKAWFKEMFNTTVQNNGFLFKHNQKDLPLLLDIYYPENDDIKKRPLLLFIHGGAFFFGDKVNTLQQMITQDLVKKGFVAASINYRLGTSISVSAIERTIYREVQDTRAALRYLLHNKDKYGIDEEQIYLVGSSAGGIVALTTAYMEPHQIFSSTDRGLLRLRQDLGGLDDSGNDLKADFKVAGVVSMWGGVTDLKIVDNHIPTLLFHGTADVIVPCDEGLPFKDAMGGFLHKVFTWFGKIYGSEPIYKRLLSIDAPVKYVPFEGAGHDPCIEPDNSLNECIDVIEKELALFLYDNVSQHYFPYWLTGHTSVGKGTLAPIYKVDNLGNSTVQWSVEGGFITNQTIDSIRVIWYHSSETGVVLAHITDNQGITCIKSLTIMVNG